MRGSVRRDIIDRADLLVMILLMVEVVIVSQMNFAAKKGRRVVSHLTMLSLIHRSSD
ncbi:MAG TPA: hypothetical protein PLH31_02440 [Caulobacter sp.]|nr:hypothetical protein [Caulobacter sp.]